jgi:hypothetical protein
MEVEVRHLSAGIATWYMIPKVDSYRAHGAIRLGGA